MWIQKLKKKFNRLTTDNLMPNLIKLEKNPNENLLVYENISDDDMFKQLSLLALTPDKISLKNVAE